MYKLHIQLQYNYSAEQSEIIHFSAFPLHFLTFPTIELTYSTEKDQTKLLAIGVEVV